MRPMLGSLLLVAALILFRGPVARGDEPARPPAPPLPSADLAIREALCIRKAKVVVFGRVAEVHESPGIWCGIAETWQEVTWKVERVVDGRLSETSVRVAHLLVAKSRLVDAETPRLDPGLVHSGATALLFLTRRGDRWFVLDEDYGTRLTADSPTAD